jgi:hypothetical protein
MSGGREVWEIAGRLRLRRGDGAAGRCGLGGVRGRRRTRLIRSAQEGGRSEDDEADGDEGGGKARQPAGAEAGARSSAISWRGYPLTSSVLGISICAF